MYNRVATIDKKKFQQEYCRNCINGFILEKQFDNKVALNYLKSLGIKQPEVVTENAFAQRAKYEAMKNGIDSDFLYKVTDSYECLFSGMCTKINDKVIPL